MKPIFTLSETAGSECVSAGQTADTAGPGATRVAPGATVGTTLAPGATAGASLAPGAPSKEAGRTQLLNLAQRSSGQTVDPV